MSQYLVTGGAGFIGSHIVDELLRRGQRVRVLDSFDTGKRENLAFALDYEDVVLYTIHAGPIVIPAALAVGEKLNVSGKDFILSVVLGYEIGTRIGLSMQPSAERGSKVWGQQYTPFAACVTAGKLLGLNEEQMDIAFGVTGTYATVPSAYKYFGIVNERWNCAIVFNFLHFFFIDVSLVINTLRFTNNFRQINRYHSNTRLL